MKKMMIALMAMLTIAASASAMSYEQARNEALFLTDKMAYELNLNDAQYEAAYEINLDYLMGVTSRYDVFGTSWERRNLDLRYILMSWQWDLFRAASYFYRPLIWDAGYWHFRIYTHYPHRDYFYFGRPHFYASYRGGHSWHLNGGRSFYETRSHVYHGNGHRDNHFGMRDSWDRGDYRGGRDNSSTRSTVNHYGGTERQTFGASRPAQGSGNGSQAGQGTGSTSTQSSAGQSSGNGRSSFGGSSSRSTSGSSSSFGGSSSRSTSGSSSSFGGSSSRSTTGSRSTFGGISSRSTSGSSAASTTRSSSFGASSRSASSAASSSRSMSAGSRQSSSASQRSTSTATRSSSASQRSSSAGASSSRTSGGGGFGRR